MKNTMHVVLLSLWIGALLVPSFVTLLHNDEKPAVVLNLNEEEQQEQGATDTQEKLIFCHSHLFHEVLRHLDKADLRSHGIMNYADHTQEIDLPPPEQYI